MKKKFILFPLSFVMIASLTACDGRANASTSKTDDDSSLASVDITVDENIKADLTILVPGSSQQEQSMVKKAFDDGFALNFPNVNLKFSFVSIGSYETTVRQQAMSNSLPDIVWTNSPEYLFLSKNQIAEPLNAYMAASAENGDWDMKDYKESFFNMGSINSKYYVMPRSADTVVCFFNRTLLKNANIDISKIKNGWTWSDFKEVCQAWRNYQDGRGNTVENGFYCCDPYMTSWNSVSYPMLKSFGGSVIGDDGKVSIDNNGTRAFVNEYRDIVSKGYVVAPGTQAGSSFESGQTPFVFQSASFSHYADGIAAIANDDLDVVTMPLINDNNTPFIGAGIAGYTINTKSKNKALAWAFLRYLLTKEGQELMAKGGLNVPPIRNDMDDFTKEEWGKGYTDKNLSAYTLYPEYKTTDDFLSKADVSKMANLNLAYQDFVSAAGSGKKSVDTVISEAVEDLTDALNSK